MSVNLQSIGISGIAAAEAGLAAIESNITNASNPNYSAESVGLAARPGPNGAGAGVDVLGTSRAEAPFLNSQINQTQASQSYNAAFSQVTTLAQQILAPSSGADLSQALQDMFNAFTNLSASPQDATLRATALNSAANFAQLAQIVSSSLVATAGNELKQVTPLVAEVNQASQQIATLNAQILQVQTLGGNAAALMDQRDGLTSQLATLIGASGDSSGNVTVGGVPLVSGGTALTLATTGSGTAIALQVNLRSGSVPVQMSTLGGTIGGVLAGAQSVLQIQQGVDDFVTSIATAMNTQHQSGFGLDGSTGNALFQIPGAAGPIAIDPAITEQNLAASSSAAALPGDGSNAAAIAALANVAGIDPLFANSTPVQAFTQIISGFASSVHTATNNQQQAAASLQSLNQLKGSITGVSLNDQLTRLLEFQNLLQAAGRAVQAANDITTFLIQEVS
jgi:flagellar hook-associated protein 1 FlgK